MIKGIYNRRFGFSFRLVAFCVILTFSSTLIVPPSQAQAQTVLNLPVPGTMVQVSPGFTPVLIKGVKIDPQNPLHFNFIVDSGEISLPEKDLKKESERLVKYFMASLTTPEEDLWVNLSPYEEDRIIPEEFSVTEMGRDMLAQDYLLKQLTASLIYPENELGEKFWERVRAKTYELYGSADILVNTFNKVWIMPDKAVVYEKGNTAFVIESHLKVMLEEDYLALKTNTGSDKSKAKNQDKVSRVSNVTSHIMKEIVLPEIEREVNEGKNFSQLRQIYNSLILGVWFKQRLRESLLGQIYVDQKKISGIDLEDKTAKEKIYQQYLEAYKKGVYNYIREDYDPKTKTMIPRKYFSGGAVWDTLDEELKVVTDLAMVATDALERFQDVTQVTMVDVALTEPGEEPNLGAFEPSESADAAMVGETEEISRKMAFLVGLLEEGVSVQENRLREELAGYIEKAAGITRSTYERLSRKYTDLRSKYPEGRDLEALQELMILVRTVRSLATDERYKVLDIGTGLRDLIWFSGQDDVDVTGIDISESLINLLRRHPAIPRDVKLEVMDMNDMKFTDSTFDGVRAQASLHHLPLIDLEQGVDVAVQETRRIIRPGGVYYVFVKAETEKRRGFMAVDTSEGLGRRFYQFYSKEMLQNLLERNGFEVKGKVEEWTDERGEKNLIIFAQKPLFDRTPSDLAMVADEGDVTGRIARWKDWVATTEVPYPWYESHDDNDDIAAVLAGSKPAAFVMQKPRDAMQVALVQEARRLGFEVAESTTPGGIQEYIIGLRESVQGIERLLVSYHEGRSLQDENHHRRLGQFLGYPEDAIEKHLKYTEENRQVLVKTVETIPNELRVLGYRQLGNLYYKGLERVPQRYEVWEKGSRWVALRFIQGRFELLAGPNRLPWDQSEVAATSIDEITGGELEGEVGRILTQDLTGLEPLEILDWHERAVALLRRQGVMNEQTIMRRLTERLRLAVSRDEIPRGVFDEYFYMAPAYDIAIPYYPSRFSEFKESFSELPSTEAPMEQQVADILFEQHKAGQLLFVGDAGDIGVGKTFLAHRVTDLLRERGLRVRVLGTDDYLKVRKLRQSQELYGPGSLKMDLLSRDIISIKERRPFVPPRYDPLTGEGIEGEGERLDANELDVVIFEGLSVFAVRDLGELFDVRILVEQHTADSFGPMMERETTTRGYSPEGAIWDAILYAHYESPDLRRQLRDVDIVVQRSEGKVQVREGLLGGVDSGRDAAMVTGEPDDGNILQLFSRGLGTDLMASSWHGTGSIALPLSISHGALLSKKRLREEEIPIWTTEESTALSEHHVSFSTGGAINTALNYARNNPVWTIEGAPERVAAMKAAVDEGQDLASLKRDLEDLRIKMRRKFRDDDEEGAIKLHQQEGQILKEIEIKEQAIRTLLDEQRRIRAWESMSDQQRDDLIESFRSQFQVLFGVVSSEELLPARSGLRNEQITRGSEFRFLDPGNHLTFLAVPYENISEARRIVRENVADTVSADVLEDLLENRIIPLEWVEAYQRVLLEFAQGQRIIPNEIWDAVRRPFLSDQTDLPPLEVDPDTDFVRQMERFLERGQRDTSKRLLEGGEISPYLDAGLRPVDVGDGVFNRIELRDDSSGDAAMVGDASSNLPQTLTFSQLDIGESSFEELARGLLDPVEYLSPIWGTRPFVESHVGIKLRDDGWQTLSMVLSELMGNARDRSAGGMMSQELILHQVTDSPSPRYVLEVTLQQQGLKQEDYWGILRKHAEEFDRRGQEGHFYLRGISRTGRRGTDYVNRAQGLGVIGELMGKTKATLQYERKGEIVETKLFIEVNDLLVSKPSALSASSPASDAAMVAEGFSPLSVPALSPPSAADIDRYEELLRRRAEIEQERRAPDLGEDDRRRLNQEGRAGLTERFELIRRIAPYSSGDILVDVDTKTRFTVKDALLASSNLRDQDLRFELRLEDPDGIEISERDVLQGLRLRPAFSNAREIALPSGETMRMLELQKNKERWGADPESKIRDLKISSLTQLQDNDTGYIEAYEAFTPMGMFFIIMKGNEAETVALEHVLRHKEGEPRIFIDLSGESYSDVLREVIAREIRSFDRSNAIFEKFRSQKGKVYAPMAITEEDRDSFERQVRDNIFLRHLVEAGGFLEHDLSIAGVYTFLRDKKRRHAGGAVAMEYMPLILEPLSATFDNIRSVSHPKGWSTVAHEMIHSYFAFILPQTNRYDEIRSWLREAHSDFLDEVVADYNDYFLSLPPARRERYNVNEGLAMLFDSFISPRFGSGGGAVLRLDKYKLLVRDVNSLIALGLVPERFRPADFGYSDPDQNIDAQYYERALASLARDGMRVDAENIVNSSDTTHSDSRAIKPRLLDAIAAASESDAAMVGGEIQVFPKVTHTGRNNEVIDVLRSPLFKDATGLDLSSGNHTAVNVGVGAKPYDTIQLVETLQNINPNITVYGTEVPTNAPLAHIRAASLLERFREDVSRELKVSPDEIVDVVLVINQEKRVIEAQVGFEKREYGKTFYTTFAVSPDAEYVVPAGQKSEEHKREELFERFVKFLGDAAIRTVIDEGITQGKGDLSITFDPIGAELSQSGARFVATENLAKDGIEDASIIMANYVTIYMPEAERISYREMLKQSLREGGILVETINDNPEQYNAVNFYKREGDELVDIGQLGSSEQIAGAGLFERKIDPLVADSLFKESMRRRQRFIGEFDGSVMMSDIGPADQRYLLDRSLPVLRNLRGDIQITDDEFLTTARDQISRFAAEIDLEGSVEDGWEEKDDTADAAMVGSLDALPPARTKLELMNNLEGILTVTSIDESVTALDIEDEKTFRSEGARYLLRESLHNSNEPVRVFVSNIIYMAARQLGISSRQLREDSIGTDLSPHEQVYTFSENPSFEDFLGVFREASEDQVTLLHLSFPRATPFLAVRANIVSSYTAAIIAGYRGAIGFVEPEIPFSEELRRFLELESRLSLTLDAEKSGRSEEQAFRLLLHVLEFEHEQGYLPIIPDVSDEETRSRLFSEYQRYHQVLADDQETFLASLPDIFWSNPQGETGVDQSVAYSHELLDYLLREAIFNPRITIRGTAQYLVEVISQNYNFTVRGVYQTYFFEEAGILSFRGDTDQAMVAGTFDSGRFDGYLENKGHYKPEREKARRIVEDSQKLMLTLGAGKAKVEYEVAAREKNMGVLATDLYPLEGSYQAKYKEVARDWANGRLRTQQEPLDNLVSIRAEADILYLLPDESLDYIVMINPVEGMVAELYEVLMQSGLLRKLKPGGKVIIKSKDGPVRRTDTEDFFFEEGDNFGFRRSGKIFLGVDINEVTKDDYPSESYIYEWQKPIPVELDWGEGSDAAMVGTASGKFVINNLGDPSHEFDVNSHPIADFLSEGEMADLEDLGFDSGEVLNAITNPPRTEFLSVGFTADKKSFVDQPELIKADFRKMIRERAVSGEKTITIYEVGVGLEPKEALAILDIFNESLAETVASEERRDWTLRLIALEFEQGIMSRFQRALYDRNANRSFAKRYSMNLEVATALADTMDSGRLEELGRFYKGDYIFHRNVAYSNSLAQKGIIGLEKLKPENPDIEEDLAQNLNVYIATRNILRALSKVNTRYITEPAKFLDGRQGNRVLRIPGTQIQTANYYSEAPSRETQDLENIGTGIYIVNVPSAMAEVRIRGFLENIDVPQSDPAMVGKQAAWDSLFSGKRSDGDRIELEEPLWDGGLRVDARIAALGDATWDNPRVLGMEKDIKINGFNNFRRVPHEEIQLMFPRVENLPTVYEHSSGLQIVRKEGSPYLPVDPDRNAIQELARQKRKGNVPTFFFEEDQEHWYELNLVPFGFRTLNEEITYGSELSQAHRKQIISVIIDSLLFDSDQWFFHRHLNSDNILVRRDADGRIHVRLIDWKFLRRINAADYRNANEVLQDRVLSSIYERTALEKKFASRADIGQMDLQRAPSDLTSSDLAMVGGDVTELFDQEDFQRAIGDVVQYLFLEAVESRFQVDAQGTIGEVEEGQAAQTGTLNTGSVITFDPELLRKRQAGVEESMDTITFDIHSHPVSIENGQVHVAPIPSEGDYKAWEDSRFEHALIVWGEQGMGLFASLVNLEKLGDYEEVAHLGFKSMMLKLNEKGALRFFRLKKTEGALGADVREARKGRLRYAFSEELSVRDAIREYDYYLDSVDTVKRRAQARERKWEERGYEKYKGEPSRELEIEVRFSSIGAFLRDYRAGRNFGAPDSEWHGGRIIAGHIRKEIATLLGLRRVMEERSLTGENFDGSLLELDQLVARAEEDLAQGYGSGRVRGKSSVRGRGMSVPVVAQGGGADASSMIAADAAMVGDEFYSAGDLIGAVNNVFYTFNSDSVFGFRTEEVITPYNAQATAHEFYDRLQNLRAADSLPEKIIMQEWGVGRGTFMIDFLVYFLELDQEREFIDQFEYQVYDISENVLEVARRNLRNMSRPQTIRPRYSSLYLISDKVTFHQVDLSKGLPHSKVPPILIRFDELYDDIDGVEIVEKGEDGWAVVVYKPVLRDSVIIETHENERISAQNFIDNYLLPRDTELLATVKDVHEILKEIEYEKRQISLSEYPGADRGDLREFLGEIDRLAFVGTQMTISIGAFENLSRIIKAFQRRRQGPVVQFFDYGFDINFPKKRDVLATFEKGYGGHLSAGVNFYYIRYMLKKYFSEIQFEIVPQLDYQRRVLGESRGPADMDVSYEQLYQFKVDLSGVAAADAAMVTTEVTVSAVKNVPLDGGAELWASVDDATIDRLKSLTAETVRQAVDPDSARSPEERTILELLDAETVFRTLKHLNQFHAFRTSLLASMPQPEQAGENIFDRELFEEIIRDIWWLKGRHLISKDRRLGLDKIEGWPENSNTLFTVDRELDIKKKIADVYSTRHKKDDPIIIFDWGAGTGTALVELRAWLDEQGILDDFILIGFADEMHIQWNEAPAGINFIFGTLEYLPVILEEVLAGRKIDLGYSYYGLTHLMRSLEGFERHLRTLTSFLAPNGEFRTDSADSRLDRIIFSGEVDESEFAFVEAEDDSFSYWKIVPAGSTAADAAMVAAEEFRSDFGDLVVKEIKEFLEIPQDAEIVSYINEPVIATHPVSRITLGVQGEGIEGGGTFIFYTKDISHIRRDVYMIPLTDPDNPQLIHGRPLETVVGEIQEKIQLAYEHDPPLAPKSRISYVKEKPMIITGAVPGVLLRHSHMQGLNDEEVAAIASALANLHSQGIVHGDISLYYDDGQEVERRPNNIILNEGRVRFIDFVNAQVHDNYGAVHYQEFQDFRDRQVLPQNQAIFNEVYRATLAEKGIDIALAASHSGGSDRAMLGGEAITTSAPETMPFTSTTTGVPAEFSEASSSDVGGIDFTPDNINLQIKRDPNGVPLPIEMQDIENIQIKGLTPVIINLTPVTNFPLLLGIGEETEDGLQLSRLAQNL